NFCVASVLGSSCTTCTLRSCAPYAPINSSKYLCFERSLLHHDGIFRNPHSEFFRQFFMHETPMIFRGGESRR
ncbi:MAG: hypothetical protein LBJ16_01705, partial [Holosporaceae bacterium]|nr:hypothetical protein [Holosporaceae bacterium]